MKRAFTNKTEDLCTPIARAIQREQERQNIDNECLAKAAGIHYRSLARIKAGYSTNTQTLDKILDFFGLELTAQPICADYREQMRKV